MCTVGVYSEWYVCPFLAVGLHEEGRTVQVIDIQGTLPRQIP